MSGRVIAIANRKGGVGKTTMTVGLAQCFQTQHRLHTLVIDTDPQMSATLALVGEAAIHPPWTDLYLERTLEGKTKLKGAKVKLESVARLNVSPLQGDINLGVVPISPAFWQLERRIQGDTPILGRKRKHVETRFRQLLDLARREGFTVIIDTPPGANVLFETVARCADRIVVPCVPDAVSFWGLKWLADELLTEYRISRSKVTIVWTQYRATNEFVDRIAEARAAGLIPFPEFEHTRDDDEPTYGLPQSEAVPRAVADVNAASFQQRWPEPARNHLIRTSNRLLEWSEGR